MKLFTTALALAKLGPDYRFHTTLETRASISNGVLTGDLALVGRGDPNLSNRKFPYVLKEEFDGPPEKDRKSTRLNSSHGYISYAVFCLKKKKTTRTSSVPT